jgi:hypothetical protein
MKTIILLSIISFLNCAEKFEGAWNPDEFGSGALSGMDKNNENYGKIKDVIFTISHDEIIFNSWMGKNTYTYKIVDRLDSVPGLEKQFSIRLKNGTREEFSILIYYANDTLMFRTDKGMTFMFDRKK